MNIKFNKYILLVFGIASLWSSLVFGFDNEPTGFRGKNWGTNISEFTGMVLVEKDGDEKFYVKKNDNMKIGEADLDIVGYGFYKDRFFCVVIRFHKSINFHKIKETLFQTYGKGYQNNEYIEDYGWHSGNVTVELDYNEISEKGDIHYYYLPLAEEKEYDDKLKAEAGAGDL